MRQQGPDAMGGLRLGTTDHCKKRERSALLLLVRFVGFFRYDVALQGQHRPIVLLVCRQRCIGAKKSENVVSGFGSGSGHVI